MTGSSSNWRDMLTTAVPARIEEGFDAEDVVFGILDQLAAGGHA